MRVRRRQARLMMTLLPPTKPTRVSGPQGEGGGRSFASLFGWKSKPADEAPAAPQPRAQPEDDGFDDELEIPAFLRRSANN